MGKTFQPQIISSCELSVKLWQYYGNLVFPVSPSPDYLEIRAVRKLKIMQMQVKNTGRVLGGCFEGFFEIWGISRVKYNNLTMLMRILSSEFPCYGPPRETSISEEETQ